MERRVESPRKGQIIIDNRKLPLYVELKSSSFPTDFSDNDVFQNEFCPREVPGRNNSIPPGEENPRRLSFRLLQLRIFSRFQHYISRNNDPKIFLSCTGIANASHRDFISPDLSRSILF